MSGQRTFKLGNGATVENNVEGFVLLSGADPAQAALEAGLITEDQYERAMARRAAKATLRDPASDGAK